METIPETHEELHKDDFYWTNWKLGMSYHEVGKTIESDQEEQEVDEEMKEKKEN